MNRNVNKAFHLSTVIIIGAAGRMGSITAKTAAARGISVIPTDPAVPEFPSLAEITGNVDAIIDFSLHQATAATLDFAKKRRIPAVIAATGHTDGEIMNILEASEQIPVFRSVNLSPAMAIVANAAANAARAFPDADISVTEIHGKAKRDRPSGTAIMLSDAVKSVRGSGIDVTSVRCGSIPGIHEVRICTGYGMLTLTHEVYDRAEYAEGALRAAEFLVGKKPGLYGMDQLFPGKGAMI